MHQRNVADILGSINKHFAPNILTVPLSLRTRGMRGPAGWQRRVIGHIRHMPIEVGTYGDLEPRQATRPTRGQTEVVNVKLTCIGQVKKQSLKIFRKCHIKNTYQT